MAASNPRFYVVDSSIYISYLLPDEKLPSGLTSIINKFVNNKVDFVAPTIIKYEIGNAMKSAVKQKRLQEPEATAIYDTFLEFPIHYFSQNYQKTLNLSFKYDLSFYDASYLALAIEKKRQAPHFRQKITRLLKNRMTITPKNKLIRDNVPNSIREQGRTLNIIIRDDATFQKEIFNKLLDEAKEVIESQNDTQQLLEELADVLEVIDSIVNFKKLNFDQIKKIQTDKRNKWGGFDQKIWLESVTEKE